LLALLPDPRWTPVRRTAVVLALLPALGSLVYKGVLFSTSAQPLWKDARWLGAYLASSALLLGCAVLLALAILAGPAEALVILRPTLGLALLLNAIPLGLLLLDLGAHRRADAAPLARRAALVLAAGLLLLLDGTLPLLAAVLLILTGSLLVRQAIVGLPHAAGCPPR
jgi:hypothetical protein